MKKNGGNLRVGPRIGVCGRQVVKVGGRGVKGYTKKVKEVGTKTDLFSRLAAGAAALCT